MRPIFQPCLVNGPFADPALFVDVLFERARPALRPRRHHRPRPAQDPADESRLRDAHAHGPFRGLRPPASHLPRAAHARSLCSGLRASSSTSTIDSRRYTWNLVENYSVDLVITACEVSADGSRISRATVQLTRTLPAPRRRRERTARRPVARRTGPAGALRRARPWHPVPGICSAGSDARQRLAQSPGATRPCTGCLAERREARDHRRRAGRHSGHGPMARRRDDARGATVARTVAAGGHAVRAGPEDRLRLRRAYAGHVKQFRAHQPARRGRRPAVHRGDVSRARRRRG